MQILGKNQLTEQPQTITFDSVKGEIITRTWQGPKALAEIKYNQLKIQENLGQCTNVTIDKRIPCTVTSSFGANDTDNQAQKDNEAETLAVWELQTEQVSKPIESHPDFDITGASAKFEQIQNDIENRVSASTDYEQPWNDYRDLKLKGTDDYLTFTVNVKKTIYVTKKSQIKKAVAGAGTVVKASTIKLPKDVSFYVPDDYEMLTIPPSISWTGKKYQIVQEWLGAEKWSKRLYGSLATGTP